MFRAQLYTVWFDSDESEYWICSTSRTDGAQAIADALNKLDKETQQAVVKAA